MCDDLLCFQCPYQRIWNLIQRLQTLNFSNRITLRPDYSFKLNVVNSIAKIIHSFHFFKTLIYCVDGPSLCYK